MAEIKGLQGLIEDRAQKRLESDLRKLSDYIRNNRLTSQSYDVPTIPIGIEKIVNNERQYSITNTHPFRVFALPAYGSVASDRGYMGDLYRYWLPKYIEEESMEFLKKVDGLSNDVQELLDFKEQQGG